MKRHPFPGAFIFTSDLFHNKNFAVLFKFLQLPSSILFLQYEQ